jgi:hypothetical protein
VFDDVRPLRLVPALVSLRDRYGDPFWILGVEIWTTVIVLRFAFIETEMTMHNSAAEWFRVDDDLGVTYGPRGGGMSGGEGAGSLEHRKRFSGQLAFAPGLTDGAKALTITFGNRIPSDPVEIDVT